MRRPGRRPRPVRRRPPRRSSAISASLARLGEGVTAPGPGSCSAATSALVRPASSATTACVCTQKRHPASAEVRTMTISLVRKLDRGRAERGADEGQRQPQQLRHLGERGDDRAGVAPGVVGPGQQGGLLRSDPLHGGHAGSLLVLRWGPATTRSGAAPRPTRRGTPRAVVLSVVVRGRCGSSRTPGQRSVPALVDRDRTMLSEREPRRCPPSRSRCATDGRASGRRLRPAVTLTPCSTGPSGAHREGPR